MLIVSEIGNIWYSRTMLEFINYQLWTSYRNFLGLKYSFHFFLISGWLHLFTRALKSNCTLLSCHVSISEWIYTLYMSECQGTRCSKQAWYLKFKWIVTSWKYGRLNIAQTSFLCYVASFQTPTLMKRAPPKMFR